MIKTERNPDVNLDLETVATGLVLLEGKNLMATARSLKIPFGVASQTSRERGYACRITVGIILRPADVPAVREAVARRAARVEYELARKADRRAE